jgi:hypothetical protein
METTISVLRQMPDSLDGVKNFVQISKEMIMSGYIDALSVAVMLKGWETAIETLRKDPQIEEMILREVEKYGKSTTYNGCTLTIKQVGTKYDYSDCNDSVLEHAQAQIDTWTQVAKDRQTMLKTLKDTVANPDTGEVMYPPKKSSSDKVTVQLK